MDMTEKLLEKEERSFASLFFTGKYNMTVSEASDLLDMSERYICDRLKHNFDYLSVTRTQTAIFYLDNQPFYADVYAKAINKTYGHMDDKELKRYLAGLVKKRFFINRPSFRKFLLRELKTVHFDNATGTYYTKQIQTWQVDHILKGKIRLVSLQTLKKRWGCNHNMQVYRRIDNLQLQKVQMVSNSTENPMVRYMIMVDDD